MKFERVTPMWSEAHGYRKKRQLQIAPELLGMELFEEGAGGIKRKG